MPTKAELNRTLNEQNRLIENQRNELNNQRELIHELQNQMQQLILAHDQNAAQPTPHQAEPIHPARPPQQTHQPAATQAVAPPPPTAPVVNQHPHPIQQLIQHVDPQHPIQINYYAPAGGNRRLFCRPFTRREKNVSPEAWITLFEHRSANEPLDQRFQLLGDHLDGDAEDWYLRQTGILSENTPWQEVREHFITFFSMMVEAPGVAAARMEFKFGNDIEKYLQLRNRYFDLANTRMQDRIAFFTDGCVDDNIRDGLIIATIDNLPQWLTKAKALVANLERKRARPQRFNNNNFKPGQSIFKPYNGQSKAQETKPKVACAICKNKNITAFHWHSECPHRNPNYNKATPTPTKKLFITYKPILQTFHNQ